MTEEEWFNALYELINNPPEDIDSKTMVYEGYKGRWYWQIDIYPNVPLDNEQLTLF